MQPVALDFETVCFKPGMMAPPIVCASTYHPQDGVRLWQTDQVEAMLERLLDDPAPILGHGFAYDASCWLQWYPEQRFKLWQKYEQNKVFDSIATERIIEIGTGVRGKLALDELARRYGVDVVKSEVRTDFGRYFGRPLSEYTAEHKRYAAGDAAELHTLHKRQRSRGIAADADICDLVRGDLWLRLSSNWGIRTDPARVSILESSTQAEVDDLTEAAQEWGGMRTTRNDGAWFSRNMKVIKALLTDAYGERNIPRTDGWNDAERDGTLEARVLKDPFFGVSTSRAALEESGDPRLELIAELAELLAVRNKDVKMLQGGVATPIHTRYGYAATTRTTSSSPNLQNFRRKAGIRECLIPRDGCCFVETDYPSLELFALAQFCVTKLGRRDLANSLNSGEDYHAHMSAKFLNTTYADILARKGTPDVDAVRIGAKNATYGMMGYMSNPETFAFYVNQNSRSEARPKGLQWTAKQADDVMKLWRRNATDPVAFLKYVDTLKNGSGTYDVEIPGTTIMRRGCTRTAAANTHFQGLGTVVARRAGWKIAKAQYIDCTMPARTVLFVHDAFVAECQLADRNIVAKIHERCMADALHEVCPDMRVSSEADGEVGGMVIDSAVMDHYSKNAKHKRDQSGDLVVCKT